MRRQLLAVDRIGLSSFNDQMLVALAILCAVVLVAWFVVYVMRADGDAVEAVSVPRSPFEDGDLPGLCCKTGAPADVGVTVLRRRWFRSTIEGIVPITNEQFARFRTWQRINVWSVRLSFFAIVLSFPLAIPEFPSLIEGALVVLVLAPFVVAVMSNLIAQRCLVEPRLERDGSVTLRGVHPAFVLAVQEARRATVTAPSAPSP